MKNWKRDGGSLGVHPWSNIRGQRSKEAHHDLGIWYVSNDAEYKVQKIFTYVANHLVSSCKKFDTK